MDNNNRINVNKMKNTLFELSNKNESLSKENNDLNIKLMSLFRMIKTKEAQINNINQSLKTKAIKNLFHKKLHKEKIILKNAFLQLKYYKQKKYLKPKLYYDHEIYFYITKTEKNNLLDKAVGEYNTNLKLFKRRETCLTLLKKRKYIYNNYNYINNNNNIYNNNKLYEYIVPDSKVNSLSYNGYPLKNNNHNNNYDYNAFHINIPSQRNRHFFDNKSLLITQNTFALTIDEDKINKKEEYIKNIEKENNNLKLEIKQKNENIEKINILYENNESQIETLNKNLAQLQDELIQSQSENNSYKKINEEYLSLKKQLQEINTFLQNKQTNIQIDSLNKTNINFITQKKNNNNSLFLNIAKVYDINYFPSSPNSKELLVSHFENALSIIEKKNNLFKFLLFKNKLQNITKRRQIFFYLKIINISNQNKIKTSFEMFRNLLISLKIKTIIKKPPNLNKKKFYFYLFQLRTLQLSALYYKQENISLINDKNNLNSKILVFTDTFKLYEETHTNETKEKNEEIQKYKNMISELNNELSGQKEELETIRQSTKDINSQLIKCNNECDKKNKIICGLNEEINELKTNKNVLDNKILTQQQLIKELNSKMQQYQEENEQNEQHINDQIQKVQSQFKEYANNIDNLNKQKNKFQKDNDLLKVTNNNLSKNNEELIATVNQYKNFEKQNNELMSQNEQLKFDNELINQKYLELKEDFDNLKLLSEESKNELSKAMHEMELYSQLLQTLENKVKKAENERDQAVNDVKIIRQKYVDVIGDKFE